MGVEVGVRKVTRVLSGVAPVAIMARPHPCPRGRCIYCPGGPEFSTPQSYVGEEPALMRAKRVDYDPYLQVHTRLRQYRDHIGWYPSKVELVVMGGTFLAYPRDYQVWFVTEAFRAMNDFPNLRNPVATTLEEEHMRNEGASVRCVGLTLETRPDWGLEIHADLMLALGATKVELGVQSIYDEVLTRVKRGHDVSHVIKSTRILKDAGFKVAYHIMPGLPGSDVSRDLEMVRTIFENPDFRPDYLKIYPTLVMEGTELYEMWKRGDYRALSTEDAVELISEMMRYIPKYVRVQRIQRDVPAPLIIDGPRRGDLRELVEEACVRKGIKINEIRWREVGRASLKRPTLIRHEDLELTRTTYQASEGIEEFLALEDHATEAVAGILRLRIPSQYAHRPEVSSGRKALIRELHVYGMPVAPGTQPKSYLEWQHRGIGKKLMAEAERVAFEEYDVEEVLVLSGVGVRGYYRALGYTRHPSSPYMCKNLRG
ncbi:MAG: tRNA uridine(34) 5-carboxymethylaminomethyl modification radical SAM/GNAT enzyme Elp3 [Zestosphaera sp.]